MTKNQIEYEKLLETQRNNRVAAELTRIRDQAAIKNAALSLDETARHNLAFEREQTRHARQTEAQERANLAEKQRASKVQEGLTMRRDQETARHQLAGEEQAKRDLDERKRHAIVTEVETSIVDAANQLINEQRNLETKRHNLVMESKNLRPQVTVTTAPNVVNLTNPSSRRKTRLPNEHSTPMSSNDVLHIEDNPALNNRVIDLNPSIVDAIRRTNYPFGGTNYEGQKTDASGGNASRTPVVSKRDKS